MVVKMKNVKYVIVATTYPESGKAVVHRSQNMESEGIDFLGVQNDLKRADAYILKKGDNGVVVYSKHMLERTLFEFVPLP